MLLQPPSIIAPAVASSTAILRVLLPPSSRMLWSTLVPRRADLGWISWQIIVADHPTSASPQGEAVVVPYRDRYVRPIPRAERHGLEPGSRSSPLRESQEGAIMKPVPIRRAMIALGAFVALWCAGCSGPEEEEESPEDRLTVAKVQGEISIRMSGAAVAEVLGSPNIITTDEQRREVWVYDKVSSDRVDTSRSSYGTLILLGTSSDRSTRSSRQRTLTVIIKFDEEKKV